MQHLDRYSEVDTLLAKIRDEAQDKGDNVLPSFLYAQIWQDHNLARFDAAEAGARALLRLAREIGNFGHEIDARMVLAAVAIYRGDPAEARTTLQTGGGTISAEVPTRSRAIRMRRSPCGARVRWWRDAW